MPAVTEKISIVVVEADRDRALQIVDSLRLAGEYDIHVIGEITSLARQIKERQPDIVLIDLANPSRDSRAQRPVAGCLSFRKVGSLL